MFSDIVIGKSYREGFIGIVSRLTFLLMEILQGIFTSHIRSHVGNEALYISYVNYVHLACIKHSSRPRFEQSLFNYLKVDSSG
jgi:hypothetical protein